jgi:RHS repeat-associated protein
VIGFGFGRRVGVAAGAVSTVVAVLLCVSSGRATPPPPYYGPAVLGVSSVEGYWPLDETSGTTAADQTSSPASGTYHSGVTLGGSGAVQTSTDYAPSFNGSSGYVSTASVSKLQPTASASLEVWFKTSSSGSVQAILSSGQSSGLQLLLTTSGHLEGAAAGTTIVSSSSYTNGAWHYAVLTWDGSVASLYVDGVLAQPLSGTANPVAETTAPSYSATGVAIGALYTGTSGFFSGLIDEPAVYGSNSDSSGALSAGEVANHYAAALTGLVETPVNVVAPTVSGRPLVGTSYTVTDNGSWNASTEVYGSLSFTYQWLRCNPDGSGCVSISGATSSSYTVASADSTHALAVRVSAADSSASGSATVVLSVVGGYRAAVLGTGSALHGYWPLDEVFGYPLGRSAADISNSPVAGAYQSGTTLNQTSTIIDGNEHAASFNGSTYVSVPSTSKLQPTASASLEVWFKGSSTATVQRIMSSGQSSGLQLLLLTSGVLDAAVAGTQIFSSNSYDDNKWHYVVLTWDGSQMTLYVDGGIAPSSGSNPVAETTAPSYSSTGVFIGAGYTLANGYTGLIDEPALYGANSGSSGALTAAQVAYHYALRSPLAAPASWSRGGSNDAVPGLCNCAQVAADPVNTATGDFSDSWTDVTLNSYGPAVGFSRTYDSSLAQAQAAGGSPGALGYGWTDNWAASLAVTSGTGMVTVTQPDGAQVSFYPPVGGACQSPYQGPGTSGTYCALPDVTATLTYNSGSSTYTFTTHPYQKYTFNSSGKLTGQAGPGGASMTIAYSTPSPGSGSCPGTASSCMTVTSASGRTLVIAKNSSNEVVKVIDPLSRAWTYTYCTPPSSTCSTGDLISVTDPMSRVTSYAYDETNSNTTLKHDLLSITRPNGQSGGPNAGAKLVNAYNSAGQVTSQTDPNGYQTTFDYTNMNTGTGLGYVVVTDPDGNQRKDSYYDGVLDAQVQGYGGTTTSTTTSSPDPSTLLDSSVTDPNGTSSYSYNSNGSVTQTTDPLGQTATYTYNSFDEPTCAAQAMAASPCSSLTPPSAITPGGTISPPSSTPPKYVTFSEYDTAGNLVWTTAGAYNPGSSTPDHVRTTYSLYSGESVTLSGSTDSCTATPPSTSLPCATIDGNGVVTQLGYDTAGDVTSSSTLDGNSGGELAKTSYTYEGDGEQTSVVAPDGNLTGATVANFTTTTAYDNDAEVSSTTVGHTGGGLTARTTSYGYDGDGNRTSTTDPRGKVTTSAFDADDELVLVTDPDSQATLSCYDGDGNLTQTVAPVGVAASSLTPSSCPSSYPSGYGTRLASDATTYTYNYLGEKTTVTTPAPAGQTGHETTTYAYDAEGQVSNITAPPASNSSGAPNQVTAYTYDNDGQLLTTTTGSGTTAASTTSYCYDPDGDKTATVAPNGNTSSVATCSSSSPYQTSSAYQTGYAYDSLGELITETRPATSWATSGQTTTNTYDPAGNLFTSQDPNGVTTTNTYTPLNRTASTSYSSSAAPSVSYSYDANGNRLTMTDGTGTSSYSYDPFNELTSYQNGAGKTVTYAYNDDGKTTGITYPLGSGATWATTDTVGYGYDNADELNSITDFDGNAITVANTADGLPNSLTLASTGDAITTTYDPTDQPSQITLANSSSTLLQFTYSDTPSGAVSTESDTPSWAGSPASYDYDAQSRVTQMTPGTASSLAYSFDASGNATSLPTGATAAYDHASELTASTQGSTTTNYTYDADGERTQETVGGTPTVTATYDGAGRLTGYDNNLADMSTASYNGDGLRESVTTTPTGGTAATETFTWDVSRSLPRLLMDADNAYIYGPGTTPIQQVDIATGATSYLVADTLGSVRSIVTGSSGAVVASTGYDAWGNPETSGGLTSDTPFGFAGAYSDATGLAYLIRRYYDPETAQFVSADPLLDSSGVPYDYANDDPVENVDPTGLCAALADTSAVNDLADQVTINGNDLAGQLSKNVRIAFKYMTDHGLSAKVAAAIIGNLMQESYPSISPTADNGQGCHGIASWCDGRWQDVMNAAPRQGPYGLQYQLSYLVNDLERGPYESVLSAMRKAKTVQKATRIFANNSDAGGGGGGYEGCGTDAANQCDTAQRVRYAVSVFKALG